MEKSKPLKNRLIGTLTWLLLTTFMSLVQSQGIHAQSEFSGDFWVKDNGKVLANGVLTRLHGIRHIECVLNCASHGHCQSINFSEGTTECELNSMNTKGSNASFESREGWAYYEPMTARVESVGPFCRLMQPCKYGTCTDKPSETGYICNCEDAYIGSHCDILALGWTPEAAAPSCLDVRRQYGARIPPSRMYWIQDVQPLQMYCDMEVDGGGWTKVASMNITSNRFSYSSSYVHDDLVTLNLIERPYYALSTTGLARLRQLINFKSVRIYCYKPSIRRTVHIYTTNNSLGLAVVNFISGMSAIRPLSCGSYAAFPDDNSELSTSCAEWYDGTWSYHRCSARELFYDCVAVASGNHHVIVGNYNGRFECDDVLSASKVGVWIFFVR